MSDHKTLVQNFAEEIWNKGNFEATTTYVATDFVDHNPAIPNQPPGAEGARQVFATYKAAFPDQHFTIEDILVEADKVVWRWSSTGTNTGSLMGMPPTHKKATISGIEIYRIAGGKIAERWGNFDQLGLLQQLGVVPAPGQ
ncbi:MAG: ester cyclase [Anaerolineae bacterium]|nr:ester cyclase [Anaerolineae bacterium]